MDIIIEIVEKIIMTFVSFYTVDGNLFDFNNINVSFTIEIFEELGK